MNPHAKTSTPTLLSALRLLVALLVVPLLAPLQAQSTPEATAPSARIEERLSHAPNGPCKIAGSWILSSPPFLPELGDQALIALLAIAPLEPTCRRFSYELVPVNPELSFTGIFPEATVPPGLFGSVVRNGGSYELFAIAPSAELPPTGVPIRGRVLYFWTYEGTLTCTDENCDSFLQEGVVALYSSIDDPDRTVPEFGLAGVTDQDRDDDGLADEGEDPILSAPFFLSGRRIAPRQ